MSKYLIGNVSFDKKADIRVYIKDIIESRKITKKDEKFFKSFLKYHPNQCWVSSVGDVEIYEIEPEDIVDEWDNINGYTLACVDLDRGEWLPWTFIISKIPTPSKELTKIANQEIKILDLQKQILGYQAQNEVLKNKLKKISEEALAF